MAVAKAAPAVAVLSLVTLAALVPTPARSDEARRAYVVAAIGDSLTDARSGGGLYLQELRARCPGSRFDNYGKGGEMVNQMRHRFARDVFGDGEGVKPKYTTVIVFGGVNDLYSDLTAGRTVEKITGDLSAMYAAAHAHGMRVVALTVAPWGGFRRYYSPARAATTAELNRWILSRPAAGEVDAAVDTYPLLSCGDPETLCDRYVPPFHDGLHFGLEGHKRIAAALYEQVFADCR